MYFAQKPRFSVLQMILFGGWAFSNKKYQNRDCMHSLYSCTSWWLFNKLWGFFISPPVMLQCQVLLSLMVVFCWWWPCSSWRQVLHCSVSPGQAFSLDLWIMVPSILHCNMWQMPLLVLKHTLSYTGRKNQSQWSVPFGKMNVVTENSLNLWLVLFVCLLHALSVTSYIAECLTALDIWNWGVFTWILLRWYPKWKISSPSVLLIQKNISLRLQNHWWW